jgi:hypothetical protein
MLIKYRAHSGRSLLAHESYYAPYIAVTQPRTELAQTAVALPTCVLRIDQRVAVTSRRCVEYFSGK